MTQTNTLKIMSVVEAGTITGPAKNLLDFHASSTPQDTCRVELSFVTYHRSRAPIAADEAPNEFVARSRAAGIPVDVIPERFPFDSRVITALRRLSAKRAPHIIETHHVKSHFLLRLSGAWRRRAWIAWHHGYTQTDAKVKLYNNLDIWSLRAARRVITVSGAFARELEAHGVKPERIRVLHNSIVPDWLTPERAGDIKALRTALNIESHEKIILAVGRFSVEKALDDLVRAFTVLLRDNPRLPVHLVLVGDGPQRPEIESLSEALAVRDKTHFIGQVSDPAPYYALASVLALPSLSEGSPLALLEAMGAGLPIVATKVGGVPEMVEHERSALLIEPRQPENLARALMHVLTSENLSRELGEGARHTAQTRFTPQAHRTARLDIYREVVPNLFTNS
jgi:glycosyltransferase involved in cell wall biosynthesis